MSNPLKSLIATGTRLWLDSVDPELVEKYKAIGGTGATSNPIIIADLIKTGRFDDDIRELSDAGHDDETIAWHMTDRLVKRAQSVFSDVYQQTSGDTGYVSFELDPLLEAADNTASIEDRASRYVELGKQWSKGHTNRMIKVPGTPAGIAALERLAAAGVPLNVTLLFTADQYRSAREAVWKGAQKRADGLTTFKSVYSIFISRIDVYTKKQIAELSPAAQGQVGILNAKRLWQENEEWWKNKGCTLSQEIIFASTRCERERGQPRQIRCRARGFRYSNESAGNQCGD